MVYEAETFTLVTVDTARNWEQEPSWDAAIPVGEGLAGAVFKQRRPLLYVVPELLKSAGGSVYLYGRPVPGSQSVGTRTDYQALVALPLYHPESRKTPATGHAELVGALSFGSDSPASRLVNLLELGDLERSRALRGLSVVGQAVFERVLASVQAAF